jgi:hypothetical protein
MTKTCPRCNQQHVKPGTFCSRRCANSRSYDTELRQRRSDDQRRYMASDRSTEHRQLLSDVSVDLPGWTWRTNGETRTADEWMVLPPVDTDDDDWIYK